MNHENLWAPWRMAYLRELERRAEQLGDGASDATNGSFLLEYWTHPADDVVNNVVHRDAHGMVLLNRYPYANGHLLVALGEPRPTLLEYEPPQRAAFWSLVETGMALMDRALNPQGINMGINQGEVAGAGVPGHLHGHLVPRWGADTNFITVIGQVRVVPDSLEEMRRTYVEAARELGLG